MKLRRFHVEIYVPEWGRNSVQEFCSKLGDKKLEYSFHATEKLKRMSKKYRLAIHNLIKGLNISDEVLLDYVFEFYTDDDNETKKVCFRFPMLNLDTDIIVVISSTAKIVTIYLNNEFDRHRGLDVNLYERKEEDRMRAKIDLEITSSLAFSIHGDEYESNSLELNLKTDSGASVNLYKQIVDNNDKDDFQSKIEDAINISSIWTRALGMRNIHISDSVYEFLGRDEEEIKKFTDRLLIEI